MNFYKYVKNRKLYRIGMLLSAAIFVLLAFLTFYGQNSGNFVMTVDEDAYKRGLALCENKDFDTMNQWLTAAPVEDVRDITYLSIEEDLDKVLSTDGPFLDYVDDITKYLGFTFYLKNTGSEACDFIYEIKITDEIKNVSKAIRILIIVDGENKNLYESFTIYQAPDETDYEYPSYMPESTMFLDDKIVCENIVKNLVPGKPKKFSIIMWLEGEDPECVSDLFGGKIKLSMTFSIDSQQDEGIE